MTSPGLECGAIGSDLTYGDKYSSWRCATSGQGGLCNGRASMPSGNASFFVGLYDPSAKAFESVYGAGACLNTHHIESAALHALSCPTKYLYMPGTLVDLYSFDAIVFLYRGDNWRHGFVYTLAGARNLASLTKEGRI